MHREAYSNLLVSIFNKGMKYMKQNFRANRRLLKALHNYIVLYSICTVLFGAGLVAYGFSVKTTFLCTIVVSICFRRVYKETISI